MKKRIQWSNPRRKTGVVLLTALLTAALCAGCSQMPAPASSGAKAEDSSVQTAQASSAPASLPSSFRTIKAQDETVFDVEQYKEQIKNAEVIIGNASYRYNGLKLENLYENSFDVVDCQVEQVEFVVVVDGQPQTKLDVKVVETFKGDFKPGDHITVYMDGGYITQEEYIRTRQLENRFPELAKQKVSNTVYEIKNADALDQEYPTVGDRYVLGLRSDQELLGGGYFPMMGPYTTYLRDASGRYTRQPGPKADEGGKLSGNSENSFTLDWFRTQMAALAKG